MPVCSLAEGLNSSKKTLKNLCFSEFFVLFRDIFLRDAESAKFARKGRFWLNTASGAQKKFQLFPAFAPFLAMDFQEFPALFALGKASPARD